MMSRRDYQNKLARLAILKDIKDSLQDYKGKEFATLFGEMYDYANMNSGISRKAETYANNFDDTVADVMHEAKLYNTETVIDDENAKKVADVVAAM